MGRILNNSSQQPGEGSEGRGIGAGEEPGVKGRTGGSGEAASELRAEGQEFPAERGQEGIPGQWMVWKTMVGWGEFNTMEEVCEAGVYDIGARARAHTHSHTSPGDHICMTNGRQETQNALLCSISLSVLLQLLCLCLHWINQSLSQEFKVGLQRAQCVSAVGSGALG